MSNIDKEIELTAIEIERSKAIPTSDPDELTEVANARRLLELRGEEIVFVPEVGAWHIWDGRRWRPDGSAEVFQMAVNYAESLSYILPVNRDSLTFVRRSNSKSGLKALLDIAQHLHSSPITSFDKEPYYLNFLNGTLDLRTAELKPHDREDKITRLISCEYDRESKCSFFNTFLATILPDLQVRDYLQRVIGYSLLGNVRERAFFIFHGSGNNGKSVLTNLCLELMGEYACAAASGSIMTGRRGSSPSNDIARLRGKRLVVIPETSEDGKIDSALIKSLSGGDIVTARQLYKEFFDFQFTAKIWIVTNHLPAVTDNSNGFWDRAKVISFKEDIPQDKIIKSDELMTRLLAERTGIMAWAIEGCRQYLLHNDLGVPDDVASEINEYRNQEDVVQSFLNDYCEIDPHSSVYKGPLFNAFSQYCQRRGRGDAVNHSRLTRKLREMGFQDDRDHIGRKWLGLKLPSLP